MFNFPLNPALTRPLRIHSLADALTLFFADMSLSPWKFGTDQQQRNIYFLVRRTAEVLCLFLGKSRTGITLEELLNLDDALIRVAVEEGIDRKHASIYATGCRKIIEYARNCGWSCDAVVRMVVWDPVKEALTNTKDCALQLVKFLIAAGKTPAQTTEADLQSWHTHATKDGMFAATADRILIRFRGRMRLSKLDHLFPLLDLESKKRSSYRKKDEGMELAIRDEIEQLIASRSPNYLPDRAACEALRPSSIEHTVDSLYEIYGCLEDELKLGPFQNLAQVATTTNLCEAIDWLASKRGLLRRGIHRILEPILALANMFPNLDCGEVRRHIKKVPSEPSFRMRARKQTKALPYDALKELPNGLQKRIDSGVLSKIYVAWLLHDKAIIAVQLERVFRQRNIRDCQHLDTDGANLVWRKLNPEDLEDLRIPDCVRAAYDADHSRLFLMFEFKEEDTKGKRAQTQVLTLDTAETLNAYLNVRTFLVEQCKVTHGIPKNGPATTLFMNRHGGALREHNLRNLVRRLTRNYAGKAVSPHLWRDIFAAHFRMLLALGVEKDPSKLSDQLWHIDQPTTDKYSHLNKALPAIAMLNQRYRASQQALRKETSEQLAQLEPQRGRAA